MQTNFDYFVQMFSYNWVAVIYSLSLLLMICCIIYLNCKFNINDIRPWDSDDKQNAGLLLFSITFAPIFSILVAFHQLRYQTLIANSTTGIINNIHNLSNWSIILNCFTFMQCSVVIFTFCYFARKIYRESNVNLEALKQIQ